MYSVHTVSNWIARWTGSQNDESPAAVYIPLSSTGEPSASYIPDGDGDLVENGRCSPDNFDEIESKPDYSLPDNADDPGYDVPSELAPSQDELETLKRVPDRIPPAALTIVIIELCERFAFYGLSGPFQNYLQNPFPPDGNGSGAPKNVSDPYPAGALGLGQARATALQQLFACLAYVFPIVGAVIADTWWGRYKTIAFSCMIYFVGLTIITASAVPAALDAGLGLPGWIIGAVIVAAGTGGIKGIHTLCNYSELSNMKHMCDAANVAPLLADQYRVKEPFVRVLPNTGIRVLVDPSHTLTRLYNLFYWCINVGSLSALATTQIERRAGFAAAFSLPTIVFIATPMILVAGRRMYHQILPRGSVVTETFSVLRTALRGFWSHPLQFLRETRKNGILNRAKRSELSGATSSGARWSNAFVDDLKLALRACQIAIFFPLYWLACGQLGTGLVAMAGTMRTEGTPNDLLQNLDPLALIVFIPIVEGYVYPGLRQIKGGVLVQPIFRIWLGFMFAAVAMVYSACLQYFVYQTNPCGRFVSTCEVKSSINVWMQVPSYVSASSFLLRSHGNTNTVYRYLSRSLRYLHRSLD